MTGPALAARQLAIGILLGCAAGAAYGFLRPVRPRALGDGLFVGVLGWLWLYLRFSVCGGDLRLGHTLALFLGAFGFHSLLGRGILPLYSRLWTGIFAVFTGFFRFFRKIFEKITKFLFPSDKK